MSVSIEKEGGDLAVEKGVVKIKVSEAIGMVVNDDNVKTFNTLLRDGVTTARTRPFQSKKHVVKVDLSDVEFLSEEAMGGLIKAGQLANRGGLRLEVEHAAPQIEAAFDLIGGMDQRINAEANRNAHVRSRAG